MLNFVTEIKKQLTNMETKVLKLKGTKREVSTTEQPTQVLKLSGKMREVSECIEQTFSELLGD